MKIKLLSLLLIASLSSVFSVFADDEIKIGTIATLEGPFTFLGQDAMRGLELGLKEVNYTIGKKKIKLIKASSDTSPESALRAARKLVQQDKVDIIIGPLSGSEGIAIKDFAKQYPKVTFINGASAAQETTLINPAKNFFRFSTDGAQWQAGLGEYAYKVKGYRNVAVIAEDYSFPYTMTMGFSMGFCKAGGKIADKFWVPIGNKDYGTVIASIPEEVDAVYVALGGADAVDFLTQYAQYGNEKPMIAASITLDQSVLGAKGKIKDYVIGTPTAGPIADLNTPEWKKFVADYKKNFPDAFPSPSIFAHAYYVEVLATIKGLQAVKGNLEDGGKQFRKVLAKLELKTPTGLVKLDHNRNAIANIYLSQVQKRKDGSLYNQLIRTMKNVNQTLGFNEDEFIRLGPPSREKPDCDSIR